jgi:hypothetical protein
VALGRAQKLLARRDVAGLREARASRVPHLPAAAAASAVKLRGRRRGV